MSLRVDFRIKIIIARPPPTEDRIIMSWGSIRNLTMNAKYSPHELSTISFIMLFVSAKYIASAYRHQCGPYNLMARAGTVALIYVACHIDVFHRFTAFCLHSMESAVKTCL